MDGNCGNMSVLNAMHCTWNHGQGSPLSGLRYIKPVKVCGMKSVPEVGCTNRVRVCNTVA